MHCCHTVYKKNDYFVSRRVNVIENINTVWQRRQRTSKVKFLNDQFDRNGLCKSADFEQTFSNSVQCCQQINLILIEDYTCKWKKSAEFQKP